MERAALVFTSASVISNKAIKKADHLFTSASSISQTTIAKSKEILNTSKEYAESTKTVADKAKREVKKTEDLVTERLNASMGHVDKTENELIEKFNRLDPLKQPIRSISATVEVTIESSGYRNTQLDEACFLTFWSATEQMFVLSAMDSSLSKESDKGLLYRGTPKAVETNSIIGKPVNYLKQIKTLVIQFNDIKEKKKIIGGKVVVIINSAIELDFIVPEQDTNPKNLIFVNVVESSLSLLK